MNLFKNCIFACDVDGTLMDDGYINPKNIEKIEFFVKEGGCFSITTGRGLLALKPLISKLKSVNVCITGNGSMVYDFKNSKVLHEDIIPIDDYSVIEYIFNNNKNVGIEFYAGDSVYTLQSTHELKIHQNYEKFCGNAIGISDAKKLKISKVIYLFKNEEHRENIKNQISKLTTTSHFVDTCAIVDGIFYPYHEQLPPGVNKFTGIRNLKRILGFDDGLIFAMGDYYNDVEMLKSADVSAVPANSPDDVAQYADFVACRCNDGAVADFIDYLTCKFSEAQVTL